MTYNEFAHKLGMPPEGGIRLPGAHIEPSELGRQGFIRVHEGSIAPTLEWNGELF